MSIIMMGASVSGKLCDEEVDYSSGVFVGKSMAHRRVVYTTSSTSYLDYILFGEKTFGSGSYSGFGLPSWVTSSKQRRGFACITNQSSRYKLSVRVAGNDGKVIVPEGEAIMFEISLESAPLGDAVTVKGIDGDVLVGFVVYFYWEV